MKPFYAPFVSILPFAASFAPNSIIQSPNGVRTELHSHQPPYWGSNNHDNNENQQLSQNQQNESPEESSMRGNRWSKFAPDTDLPTDEFRKQLKENMKADLERRRREDPNRGNQPAKSYLDSL